MKLAAGSWPRSLPMQKILLGAAPNDVANRDLLADPTALDAFVALLGVR